MYKYGFGYIWEQPYNIDEQLFRAVFKQRLIDNAIQEWNDDLNNNRTMSLYRLVKNKFGYEKYLDLAKYKSYRQNITKIRMSSHKLRIETGRYGRNRIDRNERLCQICNCGDIEDEYHFIIICSKYSDIRKKYIAKYYLQRPSMYKFLELLSNKNHKILDNLAIFIKHALQIRNVHLTIMS